MSRKSSPTYRISRTALGRRLAAMIELELQGELAPDEFHDTIHAYHPDGSTFRRFLWF